MKSLYSSPLRVYLMLGALSLVGIFCGLSLPISLFPNSTKPVVMVRIPLGDMTARDYLNGYGMSLEYALSAISTEKVKTEEVEANYGRNQVSYKVSFPWETPPNEALKEVETIVNSNAAVLPDEMRRGARAFSYTENNGFFAANFFSPTRGLDDLFEVLEPLLAADLAKIPGTADAVLWNPAEKEIQIELKPYNLAQYQLLPVDITRALLGSLGSYQAGNLEIDTKRMQVIVRAAALTKEDLIRILVMTPSGKTIHVGDVAELDYSVPMEKSRVIRTSGSPSVMLYATPKPGGNIKAMSEEILRMIESKKSVLPPDIQYRILVDPSEFIRSSVNNVLHEVLLAAGLAVIILFLFIGSFKNVITAAIEIPMSIVLAFILMKLTGMNLNLISLGGLALSAGMNVDGSVVVMENIFRHFEKAKANLLPAERLRILLEAVDEVKLPIIASTVASIVVFAPLVFTKGLSSAILGDLAKAVIFSHGLSAVVALILVPTVRLQMMSTETQFHVTSPIEKYFTRLENFYRRMLEIFLQNAKLRNGVYGFLLLSLVAMVMLIVPALPKEVIGTPDTDWVIFTQTTQGNSLMRQMETQSDETEALLLNKLDGRVLYTFTQIQSPNYAFVMLRLKDKRDMNDAIKLLESEFPNSPTTQYYVDQWNPSELPLPNPPQLEISVRAKDTADMRIVAKEIYDALQEKQFFARLWSLPETELQTGVSIRPRLELWPEITRSGSRLTAADLADYARVVLDGKPIGFLSVNNRLTQMKVRFPHQSVHNLEELGALPVSVAGKLVPLKALAHIQTEDVAPTIVRMNQQEQYRILGRVKKEEKNQSKQITAQAHEVVEAWRKTSSRAGKATVSFENPEKEVDEAIHQLLWALAISTGLILITMILQLGHVVNSLLVFLAIPLGLLGVLLSLFIFRSTLSLNSILGVILLNGIAVANSIILVDFLNRLVQRGLSPREAALEAAQTRLRPILMTSMTTTLGMLPIALGFGEGGRILQPLGIAVSGGLGVSMLLTLFIVPALQVSYLQWSQKGRRP